MTFSVDEKRKQEILTYCDALVFVKSRCAIKM